MQAAQGLVHAALHRAARFQHLGRLALLEPLVNDQHEHLPQLGRNLLHGQARSFPILAALHVGNDAGRVDSRRVTTRAASSSARRPARGRSS